MNMKRNAFRTVYIALLVAQALVVFKLEEYIPVPFPMIPGAKLGLANIFTLVALYSLTPWETLTVVILRSVLAMIFSSNPGAFLYSFAGVVFAYLMMLFLKKAFGRRLSRIGVSVGGAFAHNLGQLLAASLVSGTMKIMLYLPALTLIAVPTGFFVGLIANFLLEHINKLGFFRELNR